MTPEEFAEKVLRSEPFRRFFAVQMPNPVLYEKLVDWCCNKCALVELAASATGDKP